MIDPGDGQAADHAPALVHLLDIAGGGQDAVLACRAACELPGFEHHVWLMGSGADETLAADMGLFTTDRFSAEAGPAYRASATLGRLYADRVASWGGPPAGVIAWSPRAARLAEAEMSDAPRRVCVLTAGPGPSTEPRTGIVRALGESGVWGLCALGQALTDLWTAAGATGVTPLPLPACVPPTWAADRAPARAALGVTDDQALIMLLGDPAGSCDAHRLVTVTGLVHYTGASVVSACPQGADHVPRAHRYCALHHDRWSLIPFTGPLLRALPAADIVLWDLDEVRASGSLGKPSGGVLTAACAAAAGAVIVAAEHPLSREVLTPAGETAFSRTHLYPDYATRLIPLTDSAEARRAIGAALAGAAQADGPEAFRAALSEALMAVRAG